MNYDGGGREDGEEGWKSELRHSWHFHLFDHDTAMSFLCLQKRKEKKEKVKNQKSMSENVFTYNN